MNIELLRKYIAGQQTANAQLNSIAANTRPLATSPLLTQRKIFKEEATKLLGISERTYERKKARGELKPRGMGHDFFYADDLEEAMAESRRKGKI